MALVDYTGKVYGELTAIKRLEDKRGSTYYWLFSCSCGNTKKSIPNDLVKSKRASCGCKKGLSSRKDLTGQRFGDILAIKPLDKTDTNGSVVWLWQCNCGTQFERGSGNYVYRGHGSCDSCGDKNKREVTSKVNFKHGTPKKDKIYTAWRKIKERCYNKNDINYQNYGGRGITMQDSWVEDFIAFRDYLGYPPDDGSKYSVERLDNDLGYEEGNVVWADRLQQARNKRKSVRNRSGVTGVHKDNKNGSFYWVASWRNLDGSLGKRSFSINKLGEHFAFEQACLYRSLAIEYLNSLGAGYSDKHGE